MTGPLRIKHILVAIDPSEAGRNAARQAADLAERAGAELTVLSVFPAGPDLPNVYQAELAGVQSMLGRDIFANHPALRIEIASTRGVPQVEIPRFAERVKANLIVLGRKPRSRAARIILGDTADAVVRRSRLPCLQVPASLAPVRRMLVALDGTDRGQAVLRTAAQLAGEIGIETSAVTVEPHWPGDVPLISARSERLSQLVEQSFPLCEAESAFGGVAVSRLAIRHGEPVEQILAEVESTRADLVVTGFRPGGPLLVAAESSVSRRLVQSAPCAVMTVPL
jgi:nucleotide-binding universal stress UspA family protein